MRSTLARGKTSHVPIEGRCRAISLHRRDVLDIATKQNQFPYLQSHFSNSNKIVRFQFHEHFEDGKRPFIINRFIARSLSAVATPPRTNNSIGGTVDQTDELILGTRTEIANCSDSSCLQVPADVTRHSSEFHYQLESLPYESHHNFVVNDKAAFCSSSFIAEGLEGESKPSSVLSLSALSACLHDVPSVFHTTAPTLVVGTACIIARSFSTRVPCTLSRDFFGSCQVKDVVLK